MGKVIKNHIIKEFKTYDNSCKSFVYKFQLHMGSVPPSQKNQNVNFFPIWPWPPPPSKCKLFKIFLIFCWFVKNLFLKCKLWGPLLKKVYIFFLGGGYFPKLIIQSLNYQPLSGVLKLSGQFRQRKNRLVRGSCFAW